MLTKQHEMTFVQIVSAYKLHVLGFFVKMGAKNRFRKTHKIRLIHRGKTLYVTAEVKVNSYKYIFRLAF